MPVDFFTTAQEQRYGRFAGEPTRDEDIERLSPLVREHITLNGRYYFGRTKVVQRGEIRALRDPRDAIQELYLPPERRENTRFSFHCYSDPALARDVYYGRRGRINARELHEQMNSCSCLTLILACIIYWQAKQITQTLRSGAIAEEGIDATLLQHVS